MNGFDGGGFGGGYPDAASHFGARLRRSGIVQGRAPGSGNQQGAWNGSPLWRNPQNPHNAPGFVGKDLALPPQTRQVPWGPGGLGGPRPTGGPDFRTPFENRPQGGEEGFGYGPKPVDIIPHGPWGGGNPDGFNEFMGGPKPTDITPPGDPAGPRGPEEGFGPPPMGPNGYRNPLWARLMMRS